MQGVNLGGPGGGEGEGGPGGEGEGGLGPGGEGGLHCFSQSSNVEYFPVPFAFILQLPPIQSHVFLEGDGLGPGGEGKQQFLTEQLLGP